MIKTKSDIERDFFAFVEASALGEEIHGQVYRRGMRPPDAKTEDIIVAFIGGIDEQVQTGTVAINVYVPDKPHGANGRMVPDHIRIAELETAINGFIENGGGSEYELESQATPTDYQAEGIEQNIIAARINFKRITL